MHPKIDNRKTEGENLSQSSKIHNDKRKVSFILVVKWFQLLLLIKVKKVKVSLIYYLIFAKIMSKLCAGYSVENLNPFLTRFESDIWLLLSRLVSLF